MTNQYMKVFVKKMRRDLQQSEVDFLISQNALLYTQMASLEEGASRIQDELQRDISKLAELSSCVASLSSDILSLNACTSTCQGEHGILKVGSQSMCYIFCIGIFLCIAIGK